MAKKNNSGMQWYDWVAYVLIVVGAINWGLVGIFSLNLVTVITGGIELATRFVYSVIGVAGLYAVITGIKLATKR